MRATIVALAMLAAAPVQADCHPPGSFRLYRSSTAEDSADKIHIATFDATESRRDYNWRNCNIAAQLFGGQLGVVVHYWCEEITAR
jgi:hypothetical protein